MRLNLGSLDESMSEGLTEAEQLLRKATKDSHDFKTALDEHAIVAITNPQGRITYVNDKFCAISQYAEGELLGEDHRILNSGHHSKEFFKELWGTIGRGVVWRGEIKNKRKDGTFYWVDTTIVPFVDEGGKPEQYIAIRADITERKLYEEQLKDLAEELDRKNQEMEAVIYAASHDLRSPLVNVQGFAAVVEEEVEKLEELVGQAVNGEAGAVGQMNETRAEIEQAVGFIQAGAAKMDALLGGLLVMSRLGRVEMTIEELDVGEVVAENLAAMKFQLEQAGAEVIVGEIPKAVGDRDLLGQVLSNLFGNALKYADPSRTLSLEILGERREGMAVLKVKDNGIGIAPQHQEKVFSMFHRLDPNATEGQGLGLAIVRRSMDRMKGSVKLVSREGEGTEFTLELPA